VLENCEFKLTILPGKCEPDFVHAPLYNRVYAEWKKIWQHELHLVGSPQTWSAESFLRQDCIPVVTTKKDEIVGFFLHSFYSFLHTGVQEGNYLSIFPAESLQSLKSRQVKKIMSLEYMTVNTDWRNKSKGGISIAGLVMENALNLFKHSDADAALGVARIDYGVNRLCLSLGAKSLAPEVRRGNVVCELTVFYQNELVPHKDPRVVSTANKIWNERDDILGLTAKKTHYLNKNQFQKSA
jgi:hypothetical protein